MTEKHEKAERAAIVQEKGCGVLEAVYWMFEFLAKGETPVAGQFVEMGDHPQQQFAAVAYGLGRGWGGGFIHARHHAQKNHLPRYARQAEKREKQKRAKG